MIFTMDGFDAYKTYVALKNHFTSKTYDYFKYNGRSKASRESFEKRNDKYFFTKLSKHKNLIDFLVANIAFNNNPWVGDVINNSEAERCYKDFVKVKESLSYVFTNDLKKLPGDFANNFLSENGQHPFALQYYLRGEIRLETLIILDDLFPFFRRWDRSIEEKVVWPSIHEKCLKLKPFLKFDKNKMKNILVDRIRTFVEDK